MSTTFEQWQKAKARRDSTAYSIAKAYAAGLPVWAADIETFQKAEAEMSQLEAKFSEES